MWPPFFVAQPPTPQFHEVFFAVWQVTAVYQWWNYLESCCPVGKTILRLNLDETAVKTYMAPVKGLVTRQRPGAGSGKRRIAQATRKQQRSCLTHVAIVCDRPEIQPRLPQVLVGNAAVLPLYIQKELEPQLRKNVFLVRRKSAWVDAAYMVKIMELLGTILQPLLRDFQPILLLDALPAHLAAKVFRAGARCGIWIVVVPGKLTWLLQPADTHVFYKYKMYLRKRYLEACADSLEGGVHLRAVLHAMNDAVRFVLQAHEWGRAFDENGFGQRQRHVRRAIMGAAAFTSPISIPVELPSLVQFQSIWPAGTEVPLDAVFAPFLSPPCHAACTTTAHHNVALPPTTTSWLDRLRPRRSGSNIGAQEAAPHTSLSLGTVVVGGASFSTCPAPAVPKSAHPQHHRRPARPARPICASRPSARSSLQHPPMEETP